MKNYFLYLIEPEFATHYYGREFMLLDLFSDYKYANGETRKLLRKQVQCVISTVAPTQFTTFLNSRAESCPDCTCENGVYYIRTHKKGRKSEASLSVLPDVLHLHSDGTFEAETIFFEWLRQWSSYFLAVDYDQKHCAWLRPIKTVKFGAR